MKLLRDIADIRSGFPFRTGPKRVASGGCRLVQMRDVSAGGGLILGDLETVEAPANWEKQRLRMGDIVFVARGEQNNAGLIGLELPNTIAASSLHVLRVKEGVVNPHFLAWYLNLPQTRERLRTLQAGSGIPFISIDDLGQLPVQLPGMDLQDKITDLAQLLHEEQTLMRLLQVKRGELINGALHTVLSQSK